MALFGKSKAGGFMDVIRCDEPDYLVWKWHPEGTEEGKNYRENAIRLGSSLRVKEGEVAVFVYNTKDAQLDYIEGPYDEIIKTANLPVLASIIGLAYAGESPFQAEVYFINMARIVQVPFGVPYFDLYDPRFLDFGVPTAVRGMITFNIADYQEFVRLHRLATFDLEKFQEQIRDAVSRYVKEVVTNTPAEKNIPVVQIEREIATINGIVEANIQDRLSRDFGVNVSGVDIRAIELDKESEGYRHLAAVTRDVSTATVQAETETYIKDIKDKQRIQAENLQESLRIQREEGQYAQHVQTQSANMAAAQMGLQAEVGIAGAEALGKMGENGAADMSGGGFNPAGMMAGMAIGSAIGQNVAGNMSGMMQGLNQPQQTPPPIPTVVYNVAVNGSSTGPYDLQTLSQMIAVGQVTKDTLVWKAGLPEWIKAGDADDLKTFFNMTPPPIPK